MEALAVDFKAVLDGSLDGLMVTDRSGVILYANRAYASLTRTDREQLLGRNVFECFPGLDQTGYGRLFRRTLATGVGGDWEEFVPDYGEWFLARTESQADGGMAVHIRDSSAARFAEVHARNSHRRFDGLKEATQASWEWWFENDRAVYSGGWRSIGGYDESEVPATRSGWLNLVHHEDLPNLESSLRALLEQRAEELEIEVRLRHRDCSYRHVMCRARTVYGDDGAPLRIVGTMIDVSDVRRLEAELRDSEQRFAAFTEHSPLAKAMVDSSGRVLFMNAKMREMATRIAGTADEMAEGAGISSRFREIVASGEPCQSVEKLETSIGSRLCSIHRFPIKLSSGMVCMGIAVEDVTPWFETEEKLRREHLFVETILDTAGCLVVVRDRQNRFVRFRGACERLTGFSEKEVLGKDAVTCVLATQDLNASLTAFTEVLETKGQTQHQSRWRTKEGQLRTIQWVNTAQLDANGEVEHVISCGIDLTEALAAQQSLAHLAGELAAARDAALASSRAKSDFLANMSHEIRTPLNGVIGMASLLSEQPLPAHQREMAETIRSSGEVLLRLLEDILDFSRIESGNLHLESTPFSLDALVQEVASLYRIDALGRGLVLNVEKDHAPHPIVMGDPVRLKQVLTNLVVNALKFTVEGGVTIGLECDTNARGCRIVLSVRDTGIGIPKEQLGHIFESFRQGDNSTNRRFGGTGLGLAIARRLVKQMGGEIEVSSEVGSGTCFTVRLQLSLATLSGEGHTEGIREVRQGLRVLLAEDNSVNQVVAQRLLERLGCQVTIAVNGVHAVAATGTCSFDLVLMDVQMPECDGREATRRIRAAGFTSLPIIALTASALDDDREKCYAAGMNDFLSKPITLAPLSAALARWQPA